MKIVTLSIPLPLLTFFLHASSTLSLHEGDERFLRNERHLTAVGNATTTPFPRVYTAITPCPKKGESSNVDGIHFAAEVDLVGIVESGLRSPSDGTGSSFCKISFIVHNFRELSRLESFIAIPATSKSRVSPQQDPTSTASNFEQDIVGTNRLFRSMRQSDSGNHDRRLQTYATIPGFTCYRSLNGMQAWMQDVSAASKSIPNLSIQLNVIGTSYQGSNITALVITGNGVVAAGRTTEKAPMFVMTGIHAREFAPPELAARWVEFLVNGYGNNAEITSILDHTEIHLVLESNPDGRRIAETNQPIYQRKSAHEYGNCGNTKGVDLNRNFPFKWGRNDGSSSDPCAATYRGPSAASEPEVQAIMTYVRTIFPLGQRKANPIVEIDAMYNESAKGVFMDIHSYSELILWPWSFVNLESPNDYGLEALSNKYKHFNNYAHAGPNQPDFLYQASGTTVDWAYGTLGAAAMVFEIGNAFYQDCSYFLQSILPQNINALNYGAKIAIAPYSLPLGPDVTNIAFEGSPDVLYSDTINVFPTVSDSAWSADNFLSSNDVVSAIHAWVDTHPYDTGAGTGVAVDGLSTSAGLTTGRYLIDASIYDLGRHTIYFQATDSSGHVGPVSAAYFFVLATARTNTPTRVPTRIPTRTPTAKPTTRPPTRIPTKTPTRNPTRKPTRAPTRTPTRKPTTRAPTKSL